MRVALVYDYLNQLGGGERILRILCDIFPTAPVYTILYDSLKTDNLFADRKIVASFLDFSLTRKNHRWFIPLMPRAIQSLNLGDDYDLIISAGAGYGKGISYGKRAKHLHYCYTPLRYAWEPQYLNSKFEIRNSKLMNLFFKLATAYHRRWDYQMAQRPDVILADSKFIADKVEKYYGRRAEVLYPPLNEAKFFLDPKISKEDYFLAVGRLVHYKKFNLLIEAFNRLQWPLKIVGTGPEWANLKRKIRSSRIEMLGFISDADLRQLYTSARALIFPQEEDFGLTAVEAQACGTPVIALARGGALETIEGGKTGLFFRNQSVGGLLSVLENFIQREGDFNRDYIASRTRRFQVSSFKDQINQEITSLMAF